jgi:hypothetical protein
MPGSVFSTNGQITTIGVLRPTLTILSMTATDEDGGKVASRRGQTPCQVSYLSLRRTPSPRHDPLAETYNRSLYADP